MDRYYPLQRVPHSVPSSVLWRKLRPLAGPLSVAVLRTVVSKLVMSKDPDVRASLQERARRSGDAVVEQAQRIFFDNPGLDTVTVRELSKLGRDFAYLAARYLRLKVLLGLDGSGSAVRNLQALPQTGYDTLMVTGVAAGEALGYFRSGRVHTRIWWDSDAPDALVSLPAGHPVPLVRRFGAPESLRDMAADIDDLYWAHAYGQPIKITRVGDAANRRWLVSLPGTDHTELASEPNAADLEANLREELNLPNAMRRGTIESIRGAMRADGLADDEMVGERVLICGHSQGGMVAAGLASLPPESVGFTVDRLLTEGSPTRRLRLRGDVVAVAVEHDQDIVPSLDGTPRQVADQRIVVNRSLTPTKMGPLFYAHSSSTYTETVRQLERAHEVAPWGKEAQAVASLQEYLPGEDEEVRVFHTYTWQEVRPAGDNRPWMDLFDVDSESTWTPVRYVGEVELPEQIHGVPESVKDMVEQPLAGLAKKIPLITAKGGEEDVEEETSERPVVDAEARR